MTRDEFNQLCGQLTATSHVIQWNDSDVWKVGGKMFAIASGKDDALPGITFKTSKMDYEDLKELPGLRPAPYLASRGMTWIQRYDDPGLSCSDLQECLLKSYHLVIANLSKRKQIELGLRQA